MKYYFIFLSLFALTKAIDYSRDVTYYGTSGTSDISGVDDNKNYYKRLGRKPAMEMEFFVIKSNGFENPAWVKIFINKIRTINPAADIMLTLEPFAGLETVNDYSCNQIAQFLKPFSQRGDKLFIRFAHEMNGDWYIWGQKANLYITTYRRLSNSLKRIIPQNKPMMVWSPNVVFSGIEYDQYYPGDTYVDWIGLSLYSFDDQLNENALFERLNRLDFYNKYCKNKNRKLILSETSARIPLYSTNEQEEINIKRTWWRQIFNSREFFPLLKVALWFERQKEGKDFAIVHKDNKYALLKAFWSDLPSLAIGFSTPKFTLENETENENENENNNYKFIIQQY